VDDLTIIRRTIQGMMWMQIKANVPTRHFLGELINYQQWLLKHEYITEDAFFILLGGIISGKYIELDGVRRYD
jgi:hypothetical protein